MSEKVLFNVAQATLVIIFLSMTCTTRLHADEIIRAGEIEAAQENVQNVEAEQTSSVPLDSSADLPDELKDIASDAFVQQLTNLFNDGSFEKYLGSVVHDGFSGSGKDQKRANDHDDAQEKWDRFNFYEDYLKKYYPKVFVIRELFFENMTSDELVQALEALVRLFTEQPWFYFVNDNKNFHTQSYWEYILDQLSFISEFLQQARVDLVTNQVFMLEQDCDDFSFGSLFGGPSSMGAKRNSKNLFAFLKREGKQVVFDFYALSFDYVIKLFNEAILLQDLSRTEKCFKDLEFIFKLLQDSLYEQDYDGVVKTCRELLERLKTRLGMDDMSLLEEFFDDDDEGKQMAKVSFELGYM